MLLRKTLQKSPILAVVIMLTGCVTIEMPEQHRLPCPAPGAEIALINQAYFRAQGCAEWAHVNPRSNDRFSGDSQSTVRVVTSTGTTSFVFSGNQVTIVR
jgi:hypothetical protein